jgi:CRISPR-associated protein Cas2
VGGTRDETTLYLVVYDISVDKRRTKVHNTLCGYGKWTQFSVFECWLTKSQFLELRVKLGKHIDGQVDSVRFYPLCAECQNKVITVGGEKPHDPVAMFV